MDQAKSAALLWEEEVRGKVEGRVKVPALGWDSYAERTCTKRLAGGAAWT